MTARKLLEFWNNAEQNKNHVAVMDEIFIVDSVYLNEGEEGIVVIECSGEIEFVEIDAEVPNLFLYKKVEQKDL